MYALVMQNLHSEPWEKRHAIKTLFFCKVKQKICEKIGVNSKNQKPYSKKLIVEYFKEIKYTFLDLEKII